ncbi:macrophage mannose receptor 1-like [Ptychodera flava]|uniref:macrophage mannose receptor 1-like n=1 Tax=Ptychodera flava TaxID=63121 RepID=UPI00396A84B1
MKTLIITLSCCLATAFASTSCMDGWTLFKSSCYKFFDYSYGKSHTYAELTCNQQHKGWWIHLAIFEDPKEYDWAYSYLQTLDNFKKDMGTWIGITRDTQYTWKWANGANVAYGWAENQPSGSGVCGSIRRDTGGYNDDKCSAVRQFFCEYELSNLPIKATKLPSPCPQGWDYYDFSCYKFIGHEQGQIYSQAQAECNTFQVDTKTAHLANIQTSEEYNHVYSYFETLENFHGEIGVWVGLRLADEHWVWGDGTKMNADTVRLWAPDEPSYRGRCGSIHKEAGGFSAAACDHVKQYLCEAELDLLTTSKPDPGEQVPESSVHKGSIVMLVVIAVVLIGCVAVLVTTIAVCRCKRSPGDKGYTLHKYKKLGYAVNSDQI